MGRGGEGRGTPILRVRPTAVDGFCSDPRNFDFLIPITHYNQSNYITKKSLLRDSSYKEMVNLQFIERQLLIVNRGHVKPSPRVDMVTQELVVTRMEAQALAVVLLPLLKGSRCVRLEHIRHPLDELAPVALLPFPVRHALAVGQSLEIPLVRAEW